MRLILSLAALVGAFQRSEACIELTKTTNLATGESSTRTNRGTNGDHFGNLWNPPHTGCNLLPCGGDPLNSQTSLVSDRLLISYGFSKANCTSSKDCAENEFCLSENGEEFSGSPDSSSTEDSVEMGTCVYLIEVEGHIESTPAQEEEKDAQGNIIHQDEPTDGTIHYHIKYGDDPSFLQSSGFEMLTPDHITNKNQTRPLPFVQRVAFPDVVYAGNATIQVEHVTIRPDTKEMVTFYQCIDIVISNAPPPPDGNFTVGIGPETKLPGTEYPSGATPTDKPVDTQEQGLDTFYIVLIVILALILLVTVCLFVRWMQNKQKEQKQKLEDKDGDFEPVVQQDVLPSKNDASSRHSKDSEDLSKRLESEENVAHIGYGEDEDSENTPTPDPSGGGTGSKGRHFHFRYVEEDPDAEV